jgi:hypothetical protein
MKMVRLVCGMLAVSAVVAAAEQHTWTFSQDGIMQSPWGSTWSFKKNGRIDAALVCKEGTNVMVLPADGKYRLIPTNSLSAEDYAYLLKAGRMSEFEAATIQQRAAIQIAESNRKREAGRLKTEASAKRHVAQLELEAADRLENDAGRLGSRAGRLEARADHAAGFADAVENSAVVRPETGFAYVRAKSESSVKAAAADRLEGDLVGLKRQAAEKRANADRLQREAANLEAMARAMELGPQPRAAVAP